MLSQFQVPWDVKSLTYIAVKKSLAFFWPLIQTDQAQTLASPFLTPTTWQSFKWPLLAGCLLGTWSCFHLVFQLQMAWADQYERRISSESRARQQSWLAWLWHCLPFFQDCTCATESIEGSRTASLNICSYLVIRRSENMSTALAYWSLKAELNGYLSKSECHTWGDL